MFVELKKWQIFCHLYLDSYIKKEKKKNALSEFTVVGSMYISKDLCNV